MTRTSPRLLGFTWPMVAVMLLMAALGARGYGAEVKGAFLSVGIGGAAGKDGTYRMGCWVPVHVRLSSDEAITVHLAVEQRDIDGDRLTSLSGPITLSPRTHDSPSRDVWFYYWPSPGDARKGVSNVVVVDKSKVNPVGQVKMSAAGSGELPGLWREDVTRLVVVLGKTPMGLLAYNDSHGGSAATKVQHINGPDELPDQAIGLECVDTIVWNTNDVPAGQMPPEFQRKALVEWVRAGGHLVLVTGSGLQELQTAASSDPAFGPLMPMTLADTRTLPNAAIFGHYIPGVKRDDFDTLAGPFTQVIGSLRNGARVIGPAVRNEDAKAVEATKYPLAVVMACGAGDVTLVTIDLNAAAFEQAGPEEGAMSDDRWLSFWQHTTGYRGSVITKSTLDKQVRTAKVESEGTPPAQVKLDEIIPTNVDVKEQTQIRILLAVLFLGIYWAAAGPVGHAMLKYYKRTHWSWWVFGAVVVGAAIIAGATVFVMRITSYDVRHRTYVCGTINDPNASVTAFYGVVAPSSGSVRLELPAGGKPSYLAPLFEKGAYFTNPRQYVSENETPTVIDVPFRQTLKKMQARYVGPVGGISGEVRYGAKGELPLMGAMVNHTGYTLENVSIVWLGSRGEMSDAYLGTARIMACHSKWNAGETLDLGRFTPETVRPEGGGPNEKRDLPLEEVVAKLGRGNNRSVTGFGGSGGSIADVRHWMDDYGQELMSLFAEMAPPAQLIRTAGAYEVTQLQFLRPFTRQIDRTATLRADGAVLIARAGKVSEGEGNYVPAPVRLRVDRKLIDGKGDVIFAYGIPLQPATAKTPAQTQAGKR